MFDIGWTELIVVGVVMILVVGPKDLPGMLRSFGKTVRSVRRMAGDFQRQFDDALREAELDEVKNLSPSKVLSPVEEAKKSIDSVQKELTDTLNKPVEAVTGGQKSTGTTAAKSVSSRTGKSAGTKAKAEKAKGTKDKSSKSTTAQPSTAKTKTAAKTTKAKPSAKSRAQKAKTGTDA
ncbi:MAG: Sec-independent protein translocase protein TatB [Rhizobiaceae bacterium]